MKVFVILLLKSLHCTRESVGLIFKSAYYECCEKSRGENSRKCVGKHQGGHGEKKNFFWEADCANLHWHAGAEKHAHTQAQVCTHLSYQAVGFITMSSGTVQPFHPDKPVSFSNANRLPALNDCWHRQTHKTALLTQKDRYAIITVALLYGSHWRGSGSAAAEVCQTHRRGGFC